MSLEEFIRMILIHHLSHTNNMKMKNILLDEPKPISFFYAHCTYTFTMLYAYIYLESLHFESSFFVKIKRDFRKFVTSC